jgi:hypothetical protein
LKGTCIPAGGDGDAADARSIRTSARDSEAFCSPSDNGRQRLAMSGCRRNSSPPPVRTPPQSLPRVGQALKKLSAMLRCKPMALITRWRPAMLAGGVGRSVNEPLTNQVSPVKGVANTRCGPSDGIEHG